MSEHLKILVIAPHPDDESIGCGGLLHQRASQGAVIDVIFLTSGEKGGHGKSPEATQAIREAEARDAAKILGLRNLDFWREPDGALTPHQALVDRLIDVIVSTKPDLILVPHERDAHDDHHAATSLVTQAIGTFPERAALVSRPDVWMYEVWTPLQEFDQIVDITDSIESKMAAIRAHRSQCEVMSFDDASRGLARYRGEMHCWPRGDYAEAFLALRSNAHGAGREGIA